MKLETIIETCAEPIVGYLSLVENRVRRLTNESELFIEHIHTIKWS